MGFCWYQLLAVSAPILLDITVSEYYSILLEIQNITQYCPKLLNITNITQYYQYYSISPILLNISENYSILHARVILEWSRSDPEYYSGVTDITQYHEYYLTLPILPILHNITNQRFTNISQYYISNITQYYICGIQYQYYSILLILLNITYSILLNIPNPQNCAFPIQYVSIFINTTSHSQYSSIFFNITWATWRWALRLMSPLNGPSPCPGAAQVRAALPRLPEIRLG